MSKKYDVAVKLTGKQSFFESSTKRFKGLERLLRNQSSESSCVENFIFDEARFKSTGRNPEIPLFSNFLEGPINPRPERVASSSLPGTSDSQPQEPPSARDGMCL
jgi:hypothetical protein